MDSSEDFRRMDSGEDLTREMVLSDMRFAIQCRLGILIFTTILVMWYLITVLGYVIGAFKTSVSPIPVSGPVLVGVLLVPAMMNFVAWTLHLLAARREEFARSNLARYGDLPPGGMFPWVWMVDALAMFQILYIWISLGYIFLLAAETASGTLR